MDLLKQLEEHCGVSFEGPRRPLAESYVNEYRQKAWDAGFAVGSYGKPSAESIKDISVSAKSVTSTYSCISQGRTE